MLSLNETGHLMKKTFLAAAVVFELVPSVAFTTERMGVDKVANSMFSL